MCCPPLGGLLLFWTHDLRNPSARAGSFDHLAARRRCQSGPFTASLNHFVRDQQKIARFVFASVCLKVVPSAGQCQRQLYSRTCAARVQQKAGFVRKEMSKEVSPAL